MQTKPIYTYFKRKKIVSLFAQSVIHSNSPLHHYTTLVLPLNDHLVKSQLHGYHQLLKTAGTWQCRKQTGTSPHQPNQHNSYSKFSPGTRAEKQSAQYEEGKESVPEIWSSLALAFKKEPLRS